METPHAATCGVFFLVVHHDYFDFLAIILSQREGNVNKKERRDAATTFSMRPSMLLSTPTGRPIAKRAAKKEAEASYVAIRASTFLFQLCLIAQIICCRSECSALCCAKPPTASALLGGARCFFAATKTATKKETPKRGSLGFTLWI